MRSNNPIARAFIIEERLDGEVHVRVQFPNSRVLHGEQGRWQGVDGRRANARATFWLFQRSASAPGGLALGPGIMWMSGLSEESLAFGRGLVSAGRVILDRVDNAIAAERAKCPPTPLEVANDRIAELEARVKKLESRRKKAKR